jgi:hypothetical protein
MRTYHRLSAAPGLLPFLRRGAPFSWRGILSDMHTARRAGGNNTAFTLAVVFLILLVIGGFVWRTFQGEPDPQPPPALQGKGNG